jgi:hypothetical protein
VITADSNFPRSDIVVEKIVELKLTADEPGQLKKSADHTLENVKKLTL